MSATAAPHNELNLGPVPEVSRAEPPTLLPRGMQGTLQAAGSRATPKTKPRVMLSFSRGASLHELVVFTRQMATMVNSGLPTLKALQVQAAQQKNPSFRSQLEEICRLVESGSSLTRAFARFPRTFDRLYVSLIEAAETIGGLDVIFLRLSLHLENVIRLRKQVRAAMVYPSAVLVVAAVVISLMLLKVVPVFERMFAGFGSVLPAETRLVLDISRFAQANILLMLAGLALSVAGLSWWYGREDGRLRIDRLLLKLPLLGELVTRIAMARFCRTLATLVSSGVPLLEGLDICARTTGNRSLEQSILTVRQAVMAGKTLAQSMQRAHGFPHILCQMIAVGESTGELDTMLSKVGDFYEDEVENAVGTLVAMLEPIMMAFLGIVIGGLLIAMYMPVFTMSGAISVGG